MTFLLSTSPSSHFTATSIFHRCWSLEVSGAGVHRSGSQTDGARGGGKASEEEGDGEEIEEGEGRGGEEGNGDSSYFRPPSVVSLLSAYGLPPEGKQIENVQKREWGCEGGTRRGTGRRRGAGGEGRRRGAGLLHHPAAQFVNIDIRDQLSNLGHPSGSLGPRENHLYGPASTPHASLSHALVSASRPGLHAADKRFGGPFFGVYRAGLR